MKTTDKQQNEGKKVRKSSTNTKVRKAGRGGGATGTRADSPLQPVEQTTLEQISTACPEQEPTTELLGIS